MITAMDIAMIRAASSGISLPGIDTLVGNQATGTPLKSVSSLPTSNSAPIYYDATSNHVVVQASGAVLDGYDLRGTFVTVKADNVTITNSSFDAAAGNFAIDQYPGHNGLTVDHCTFDGGKIDRVYADFITGRAGSVTITNNNFVNIPSDAIQIENGTVSGNHFAGGGYMTGAHPDAIWVPATTGHVDISGNFIDWTPNADAKGVTNNAIRITTEIGNTDGVSVHDNTLIGGLNAVLVANGTPVMGTLSNISVDNNILGFATYNAFYSADWSGLEASGNKIIDYSNPTYSQQAWHNFLSAPIHTDHLLLDTQTTGNLMVSATGTTTVYGDAALVHLFSG